MRTKARERRSRAGKTARKQLGSLMHALSCIITSAGVSDDGMCKRQQQSTSPLLLYKMDLVRVTCPRQQKAALHSICCKKMTIWRQSARLLSYLALNHRFRLKELYRRNFCFSERGTGLILVWQPWIFEFIHCRPETQNGGWFCLSKR